MCKQGKGHIRVQPSYVCHADILGFSQLIMDQNGIQGDLESLLENLKTHLNNAYTGIRLYANTGGYQFFKVKVFSDNIVVGYPENDPNRAQPLTELIDLFRYLQMELTLHGYLLRGGIAYGFHYQDDDIVFGDALLEAHSSDISGSPPRIAIVGQALNNLYGHLAHNPESRRVLRHRQRSPGSQDVIFLNYFNTAFERLRPNIDFVQSHRDHIKEQLAKYNDCGSTRQKYEWLARYHNFVCRDFITRKADTCTSSNEELAREAFQDSQAISRLMIDMYKIEGEFSPVDIMIE